MKDKNAAGAKNGKGGKSKKGSKNGTQKLKGSGSRRNGHEMSQGGKTNKKGVIMEMEEEYSVSGESGGDIEGRQSSIDKKAAKAAEEQMTWREMQAENEALKD